MKHFIVPHDVIDLLAWSIKLFPSFDINKNY